MSLVGKQRKQAQLRSNCAVWWKGKCEASCGPADCPLDSWDWDGQIRDWLGLLLGSL